MKSNGEIFEEVESEIFRAEKKHPHWPEDFIHQSAIVAEESGELVRASLQYQYEGGSKEQIREEAIQTAATCIRLLKNL